jgi:DNA mismatch repair protein MutH
MSEDSLPYDKYSIDSIVEYAGRLRGHTLREMTDAGELRSTKVQRGIYGNTVEEYYFKYKPNSNPEPDFSEADLELKVTPMKKVRGNKLVAKERLVISKIDYMTVVHEDFEHSHMMEKIKNVLLITYLWEKDVDQLDYKILDVELWHIPKEDLPQIRHDWETVVNKVRSGHAEDISGSDTQYLEACTKAAHGTDRTDQPYSSVRAKPRAWALKASYMTAIENSLIQRRQRIERSASEHDMDLVELVRKRFRPYFGLTEAELQAKFGLSKSKNLCARITNRILGANDGTEIDELVKAGAKPKTIRLQKNGKPKESVSFPAFDYYKLLDTDFESSDFYGYLQQKYLFVLYEKNGGEYRLSDVVMWQMPESDLSEAKRCYDRMRQNVRHGRADISVKSKENRCCHVRPHGRDSSDTRPQPYGPPVVKKCFWLNASYVAGEIAKAKKAEHPVE